MKKTETVWFVTGASKGLGLVLCQKLLAAGQRVVATSRSLPELSRTLGGKSSRLLPLEVDLGDPTAVAGAVSSALTHFGALDVIVNNAGYGQLGTIEETTDAEARRNFDVNVFGTLNVLRAALPHLRERRAGHIFNISSIGGMFGGFSGWGIYCATKFAVAGLTESLHADLQPFGVKVSIVYPGYFRTEFLSQGSLQPPAHPIAAYEAARASAIQHTEQIHGQQLGDPEKLAEGLMQAYELADPPLHLIFGSDAVGMAEGKLAQIQRDIATHRSLFTSTDFAQPRA